MQLFFCPSCGKDLSGLGHQPGAQVRCPACSKTVVLPQSMFTAGSTLLPLPPEDGPAGQTLGDAAVLTEPAQEHSPDAEPLNPAEQAVYQEVEKIRNPKRSWVTTLLMLVVSGVLFVAMGRNDDPLLFTGSLVLVLLLHEMGHYLGMLAFGYRDVRMFFIPFFGAAVSGRKTSAEGYKEAIVSLLGPLPGLVLAAAMIIGVAAFQLDRVAGMKVIHFVVLLAVINGFNLLPILPLDGGRFLNIVLFSRNRFLEAGFQTIAAIALIVFSIKGVTKIFLYLGIWMLLSVRGSFRVNSMAARWPKPSSDSPPVSLDAPIPISAFRAILREVRTSMPDLTEQRNQATVLWQVWQKIHVQAPGAAASAALLLVYMSALMAVLTAPWTLRFLVQLARAIR